MTIASPPNSLASRIRVGPMWLRRTADRIPTGLQPQPARCAGSRPTTTRAGSCTTFACRTTSYAFVTGVREHEGRVWLGSLHEPAIAVVSL